jgi:hypothetical protein
MYQTTTCFGTELPSSGIYLNRGIQVQHAKLGTDRPNWNNKNNQILKYINLSRIKL